MKNTHENTIRPAYDGAKSRLAQAKDHLEAEQAALADARKAAEAFQEKIDSSDKLQKNAVHDAHELEGAVSFYTRRVAKAEDAATEAQKALNTQHYLLTEAQVLDRAEALAKFDRDVWASRFADEIADVLDRYMDEIYEISEGQNEAIRLGQSIGLDSRVINPENRARIQGDPGRPQLVLDDERIHTVFPSMGLDALRGSLRDRRHDEAVAEAGRAENERRAEEAAQRQAQREAAEAARLAQTEPAEFRYAGSGGRPMKLLTDTQAAPMGAAVAGRGAANHAAGTKRHG